METKERTRQNLVDNLDLIEASSQFAGKMRIAIDAIKAEDEDFKRLYKDASQAREYLLIMSIKHTMRWSPVLFEAMVGWYYAGMPESQEDS